MKQFFNFIYKLTSNYTIVSNIRTGAALLTLVVDDAVQDLLLMLIGFCLSILAAKQAYKRNKLLFITDILMIILTLFGAVVITIGIVKGVI